MVAKHVPSAAPVPDPSRATPIPAQIYEVQADATVSVAPPPVHAHPSEDTALAGLGWMLVANVLFAAMTIFARLASHHAPWAEVGMAVSPDGWAWTGGGATDTVASAWTSKI